MATFNGCCDRAVRRSGNKCLAALHFRLGAAVSLRMRLGFSSLGETLVNQGINEGKLFGLQNKKDALCFAGFRNKKKLCDFSTSALAPASASQFSCFRARLEANVQKVKTHRYVACLRSNVFLTFTALRGVRVPELVGVHTVFELQEARHGLQAKR